MATNDFLVFGGGSSPNVIDQATYAALTARLSGFQSGTALSAHLNKVWRQSSIMAAVLAQFTANFSGQNSVDDGTTATLLANLVVALNAAGITAAQFDSSTKLATTAFVKQAGESYSSIQGIATTASLNSGHVGAFIWAYGAGITLALPPVAGVPNGATITIGTPIGMTVKGNASETINNQFGVTSNTLALNAGEQAQFVSNGGSWYLASYTTVLGTTPSAGDNSTKLATTAFVMNGLYSGKGISRFTSSGTFTVPAGVTTLYVSGCAAGGGGGAGAGNNNGQSSLVGGGGGGGGGAGQSVMRQAFAVSPGAAITVTIGAAGSAGTGGVVGAGGAGGTGGNTTLTGAASLTLTGGAGGSGGAAVVSNAVGQGGGGGSGGAGSPNGSAGGDGNYAGLGGAGASSPFGGGGGSGRAATNTSAYQVGSAAGGYGAGGGGGGAGYGQASTAVTGGAGAVGSAGLIIFEW